MSDETDTQQTSISTDALTDVIHLMTHTARASGLAMRRALLASSGEEDLPLAALVEIRTSSDSEVGFEVLVKAFLVAARELDLYQVLLANIEGFLDRKRPLRVRLRVFSIAALIREVGELLGAAADEAGAEIRIEGPDDGVIAADRSLMLRALINVIENAIKYSWKQKGSDKKRHVDVTFRRHSIGGHWLIEVQSFGVGILPEELSSGVLFEYGVRGKLAQDRFRNGSGIGLAESKRIVDAHGGHIDLHSRQVGDAVYVTCVRMIVGGGVP